MKLKERLDSLYALKCPHKFSNTHASAIGILLRSIVEVSIQNIIESRSNAFYFDSFVAIAYCRALHQPGHSTSSELTVPCPPPLRRRYWDDWMREPAQRLERACIRPEVSRTRTFGKKGVSK